MELVILKVVIALAPVLAFVLAFHLLDAFKLMSWGELAGLMAAGGVLAALSYVSNWRAMDELPIGFTDYTKYAAPVVEESLKAALILVLFARNRIGFMIDAAITGFAVGAGFSLIENVFYLYHFASADIGVWLVRGFGTAVMHGGATALFGALGQFLTERRLKVEATRYRFNPLLFLPGLAAAILLHGAYNHFPHQPLLAMGAVLVGVPLTLLLIFSKSEHSAHDWLLSDHETHAQMLAKIEGGHLEESEAGRFVLTLTERFGEAVANDAFEYVKLHTELVMRAEEQLIAKEAGAKAAPAADIRGKFQQLHALQSRMGRTAFLALRPHLGFSRNDLWEMHELETDAKARRA